MIGATVQPSAPAKGGKLAARILSALVLVPLILAIIFYGSPAVEGLVVLAGALLAWEWASLCGGERPGPARATLLVAVTAAVAVGAFGFFASALFVMLAGTAISAALLTGLRLPNARWLALGVPYLALPCLALLWLRFRNEAGAELVLWILLVIWATDSGAYFAGKSIGGPKLAPRISPNKTWAGLAGGALAAALVGGLGRLFLPEDFALWPLILGGALLAVLSQGGDLFESFAKRHFGVKDSGQLIPGHGGLLDRVDGLIVGLLAFASILIWRASPT